MQTKTGHKVGGQKFTHWEDGRPKVSRDQVEALKLVFGDDLADRIYEQLPAWAKAALTKAKPKPAPAPAPAPKQGQAAFFDGAEVAAKAEPSGASHFYGSLAAAQNVDQMDRKEAQSYDLRRGFAAFFGGGK